MKKRVLGLFFAAVMMTGSICAARGDGWYQVGVASWYGGKFQGRLTANGERFDTRQMTAAHRSLPFNTRVEVTHLHSGKKVQVRINDRGPFVAGRIIDLSFAAATQLGLSKSGVADVGLTVLQWGDGKSYHHLPQPKPDAKPKRKSSGVVPGSNWLQVGGFSQKDNALRLAEALTQKAFRPVVLTEKGLFKVGFFFESSAEGEKLLEKLNRNHYNSVLFRNVPPPRNGQKIKEEP